MKRAVCSLLATCIVCSISGVAQAGMNGGGVLILHTDNDIAFSPGYDWSGWTYIGCEDNDPCDPEEWDSLCYCGCGSSDIVTYSMVDVLEPAVAWVFAMFPADSCPEVKTVSFGVTWSDDGGVGDLAFGSSGTMADMETPDASWPSRNTGTTLTWSSPQRKALFEVYWFVVYASYRTSLELTEHPTEGGYFGDDSVPTVLDPIADYGTLGFIGDAGAYPGLPSFCCSCPTHNTTWGRLKSVYHHGGD